MARSVLRFPQRNASKTSFELLRTFSSDGEAAWARNALEARGIAARCEQARLLVPEEHFDEAEAILYAEEEG